MDITFDTVRAALTIPSVTALGCITAYVFSEQKGVKSAEACLRKFFPKRQDAFYFRLDFFLSAVVGTGIGLILYSPQNGYQALAAGIGWTAAFNIARYDGKRHHGQETASSTDSGAGDKKGNGNE